MLSQESCLEESGPDDRRDLRRLAGKRSGALFLFLFCVGLGCLVCIVGCSTGEVVYREQSVSEWAAKLEDRDVLVRREAATVLGDIGPAAKTAVPHLTKAVGG